MQLNGEIKKYDIDEMKGDINHKMSTLINNLKKNEKQIINDENRNLRHLEKVEHMQRTLAEDYQNVKESLE